MSQNDCKLSDILSRIGHLGPTVCLICFVFCTFGPSVHFLGHEELKKDRINAWSIKSDFHSILVIIATFYGCSGHLKDMKIIWCFLLSFD